MKSRKKGDGRRRRRRRQSRKNEAGSGQERDNTKSEKTSEMEGGVGRSLWEWEEGEESSRGCSGVLSHRRNYVNYVRRLTSCQLHHTSSRLLLLLLLLPSTSLSATRITGNQPFRELARDPLRINFHSERCIASTFPLFVPFSRATAMQVGLRAIAAFLHPTNIRPYHQPIRAHPFFDYTPRLRLKPHPSSLRAFPHVFSSPNPFLLNPGPLATSYCTRLTIHFASSMRNKLQTTGSKPGQLRTTIRHQLPRSESLVIFFSV